MSENLHAGHRERMIEKLINSPDSLAEHELLEVLLFSVVPRKDTNAIAHKLIMNFGGLSRIFSASPKELMTVDGVGKRMASQIAVFGKIMAKATTIDNKKEIKLFSFATNKEYLLELFKGLTHEKFLVVLLDKSYKEITHVFYDVGSLSSVRIDTMDLAKMLAINKPHSVVIAHNHPGGNFLPSHDDDVATAKVYMLCKLQGVHLSDHVVIAKNTAYSYFLDGRLQKITSKIDSDDISKKIEV